jgi:hypothetical protein
MVTHEAAAKHDLLFSKPVLGALAIFKVINESGVFYKTQGLPFFSEGAGWQFNN